MTHWGQTRSRLQCTQNQSQTKFLLPKSDPHCKHRLHTWTQVGQPQNHTNICFQRVQCCIAGNVSTTDKWDGSSPVQSSSVHSRMGPGLEEYWDGVDGPAERQVGISFGSMRVLFLFLSDWLYFPVSHSPRRNSSSMWIIFTEYKPCTWSILVMEKKMTCVPWPMTSKIWLDWFSQVSVVVVGCGQRGTNYAAFALDFPSRWGCRLLLSHNSKQVHQFSFFS